MKLTLSSEKPSSKRWEFEREEAAVAVEEVAVVAEEVAVAVEVVVEEEVLVSYEIQ